MKHKIILIAMLLMASTLNAQIITGYDGGMMVHSGYVAGEIAPLEQKTQGFTFGIGGVARLHLGKHFRVGGEGYISSLNLLSNKSFTKLGWGGALVDFYFTIKKCSPYIGVTFGGGSATSVIMKEGNTRDWIAEEQLVYNKQALMVIDPFIGAEYAIAPSMAVTVKIDFLLGFSSKELCVPRGPRLYLGMVFKH